jgi:hypothetical protein
MTYLPDLIYQHILNNGPMSIYKLRDTSSIANSFQDIRDIVDQDERLQRNGDDISVRE